MPYILLHHTGCGTSKKGLALLQEHGIAPQVRKYMNNSERLSESELRDIAKKMGKVSPRAFLRAKDAEKFALPDDAADDAVFAAMAENPRLIHPRILGTHSEAQPQACALPMRWCSERAEPYRQAMRLT